MKIVGYVSRWNVSAGQRLGVFVSCSSPEYHVEVVRLIHGDPNPAGPGIKIQRVDHPLNGSSIRGELQEIHAGSCMLAKAPASPVLALTGAFKATLAVDRPQVVASVALGAQKLAVALDGTGLALRLSQEDGSVTVNSGRAAIAYDVWYTFLLHIDLGRGHSSLSLRRHAFTPFSDEHTLLLGFDAGAGDAGEAPLTFSAAAAERVSDHWRVQEPFNGRLADLALHTGEEAARAVAAAWPSGAHAAISPAVAWNFLKQADTDSVPDDVSGRYPGLLINRPTRLVAGPTFSGEGNLALRSARGIQLRPFSRR